ncbi:chemotaxis protein CheD [Ectothiorhodospira magna]|uniref:Probable chemoreceptor glutamine deamidase CheD n=2 Tax=Ectothiorhodospira magna TaxID=867345 RepID=A0A1H9C353_9GAMM|nr:chemotaxis protein CheD [Ectothiorhodospira magna]
MNQDDAVQDIFLGPGDVRIGDANIRLRTVLGSCVSVTLWHPVKKIGGMCHYVIASSLVYRQDQETRFADQAIKVLIESMQKAGCPHNELEAKLFGGGCMFVDERTGQCREGTRVYTENVIKGKALLAQYGLSLKAEHSGGAGHRQLVFDIRTGDVWLKHLPLPEAAQVPVMEKNP